MFSQGKKKDVHEYVLVCHYVQANSFSYFWVLSREKKMKRVPPNINYRHTQKLKVFEDIP